MKSVALRIALLAAVWLGAVGSALAVGLNPAPVFGPGAGYSVWTINRSQIRLHVEVSPKDDWALAPAGAPAPSIAAIAAAVGSHFAVTVGGEACPAIDQGEGVGQVYTLALTPEAQRFEMVFQCVSSGQLVLHDHLMFQRSPSHLDFAEVRVGGGRPVLQIFSGDHQELAAADAGKTAAGAGPLRFAWEGLRREAFSAQALCLIFGLTLLVRRWGDLGLLGLGLGAGNLAALIPMTLGLVASSQKQIEVGLALLIILQAAAGFWIWVGPSVPESRRSAAILAAAVVLVAAIAAGAESGIPIGLELAGLVVFALAVSFGLGPEQGGVVFGLSALLGLLKSARVGGLLKPLQLPLTRSGMAALGDDLGVDSLVLVSVSVIAGLFWFAVRRRRALTALIQDVGASSLLGMGVFWFVTSLYS